MQTNAPTDPPPLLADQLRTIVAALTAGTMAPAIAADELARLAGEVATLEKLVINQLHTVVLKAMLK